MHNLKEKIKYPNILRQSTNQTFEKVKYILENFSENDNFNEVLAIKQLQVKSTLKLKLS